MQNNQESESNNIPQQNSKSSNSKTLPKFEGSSNKHMKSNKKVLNYLNEPLANYPIHDQESYNQWLKDIKTVIMKPFESNYEGQTPLFQKSFEEISNELPNETSYQIQTLKKTMSKCLKTKLHLIKFVKGPDSSAEKFAKQFDYEKQNGLNENNEPKKFIGFTMNDIKEGFGLQFVGNRLIYKGNFRLNSRHDVEAEEFKCNSENELFLSYKGGFSLNHKQGYAEEWHSNSNIKFKGSYCNDLKNGKCEIYYDNGVLEIL